MAQASFQIVDMGKFKDAIKKLDKVQKKLLDEKTSKAQEELALMAKELMVSGIMSGRAGWKELSDMTKALKGGDTPLVDTQTFVNAITIWKKGKTWFAGLPNKAKGKRGQDLHMVGGVHEHGATIPVTDKMRKFFAGKGFPLRGDTKYIVVPPRPWFEPALRELENYSKMIMKSFSDHTLKRLD